MSGIDGCIPGHDMEIESHPVAGMGGRISCSCGFVGPWRKSRSSVYRDRDAHEGRTAEDEAKR